MSRFVEVASGTWFSTPDTSALRIVGDLDMRAKVQTSSATSQVFGARWNTGDTSYIFEVLGSTGQLTFFWSSTGADFLASTSGDVVSLDSDAHTYQGQLDISTGIAAFEIDGVSVGNGSTAGSSSIYAGTADLSVGAHTAGGADLFIGNLYWSETRDGLDGTVVARLDADDIYAAHGYGPLVNGAQWTGSVDGLTWTVHGTGATVGLDVTSFKHAQNRAAPAGQMLHTGG